MCFSNSIVTFYFFTFYGQVYIHICRQYLRQGLSLVFSSARLELKMRFLYLAPLCGLKSRCSFCMHLRFLLQFCFVYKRVSRISNHKCFCFNLFLHLIIVLRLSCFCFLWLFSVSLTGTKSPFLSLSQLFTVRMLQPGVVFSGGWPEEPNPFWLTHPSL